MNFRLLAMALGALAILAPAAAQTPDLAALARASGTPEIPGLKMVWLAPWGDVVESPSLAQHHRAPDRGAGRLGARRRAGAGEKPDAARRHGLGRNRRHGLLGGAGEPGADPYRRRRSQRQQIHRQRPDLSSGQQGHLDRGGIRRQLSRRDAAAPPRRRSRRGGFWCRVLRARYGIPLERVYAHNWIDYKDARYCEGCALATLARQWGE